MGLFSAFTVIRGLALFHLTAAYFLVVSPNTLANQNLVLILGDAMRLPETTDFNKPSEVAAFAGLILGLFAISDLVAASLPEITALEYWISAVPVRLLALFGVTGYTYLFKDGGILGNPEGPGMSANASFASALKRTRTPGELVRNNLVFGAGFVELTMWFWVFVLLRDERRNMAEKLARRQKEQEELFGR